MNAPQSTGLVPADDPEYAAILRGEAAPEGTAGRDTVLLIVHAPRDPEAKPFRFPFSEIVGDAAKTAAAAFDYAAGTPSFRKDDGTVLDRTISLQAAGVHNGEKLELVDAGGGV